MAQLGPQYYRLHNIIETESTPSQYPFGEPDMSLLDSIEQVKVAHGSNVRSFEDNVNAYFQTVQFLNLKHWRGSDLHSKRVKLEGDSGEYSTTALLENIPLGDCITAQSYCDQLNLFQTRNQRLVSLLVYLSEAPYSRESKNSLSEKKLRFVRQTTPFPILYPLIDSLFRVNYNGLNSATSAMLGILGNSATATSQYHTVFSGLLEITRHSFEMLDIVHRIIDGRLIANEEDLEFSVRFWSFIPYYPLAKWESFTPTLERLKRIANEKETVIRLVISITSMLENWLVRMEIEDRLEDLGLWNCINMVLAEMMRTIAARCFSKADESIELMMVLLRLIQFTHTMPFQFVRISDLVLSPTLAYSMYFTSNPILIDYLCRHVTYCKKYFGEYGSDYISDRSQGIEVENDINGELSLALLRNIKEIHNSYVMDLCNIVWRDKAFEKTDKSKGKGFLLPDQFTGQLLKVGSDANGFIKRGYNIFYAPAFASIITGIIRTTEDQHLSKRRLVGPLNEEEYSKLLPTESYDQFRTVILDRLHDIGFAGLGNLLFSSLKSLSRIKLEKGKSSSAQLQSV
ncbi:DEKNAAC100155 [Brettanomyces naardenensis]|uniref:DEKNAAC100155 n=1 Tax=Brettanomyces naardenensis TaxID=13370 RepID=A0A448YG11_BRENA|nr:DEKNAAC100155 [Brettanomyces naardenensis]